MSKKNPMSELPPKPSMAHYATETMRRLLIQGEWSERLPGERSLALRLGVSRPTLHQALLTLESEGLLVRRLKSAWRIIAEVPSPHQGLRKVVFLSPLGLEELDHFTLHQYTVLSAHLTERGYEVEAVRLTSVQSGKAESALKALAARLRPTAWVLHRCSPATQQWFGQSGLAAVVMGSASPKFNIRSVDVDYRAAARHAVNHLMRLGHATDRIAYLMPAEKLLGHAEAAAGLRDAAGKKGVQTVSLPEQSDALRGTVDALLRERPRPTALILHRPLHALAVLGHLQSRGIRVPEEMSLVVLDDNSVLAHVIPHPSRYHKDTDQFAAHLRKAIEQAISHSKKGVKSTRIVPELIPGETMAKPPKD